MGRKPLPIDESFFEDYLAGMSTSEISKKYNLNIGTVTLRLKKAGLYKHNRVYINNIIQLLNDALSQIIKYEIDASSKSKILEIVYKIISALNNK